MLPWWTRCPLRARHFQGTNQGTACIFRHDDLVHISPCGHGIGIGELLAILRDQLFGPGFGIRAFLKLAAVDEATGQTLSPWNPAVNTTLGIEALGAGSSAPGNATVAIGGEFTKAGGVAQQHFTLFHE